MMGGYFGYFLSISGISGVFLFLLQVFGTVWEDGLWPFFTPYLRKYSVDVQGTTAQSDWTDTEWHGTLQIWEPFKEYIVFVL